MSRYDKRSKKPLGKRPRPNAPLQTQRDYWDKVLSREGLGVDRGRSINQLSYIGTSRDIDAVERGLAGSRYGTGGGKRTRKKKADD